MPRRRHVRDHMGHLLANDGDAGRRKLQADDKGRREAPVLDRLQRNRHGVEAARMRQMKRIARPRGRALAWLAAVAAAAFTTAACGHPFTPADYSPTHPYATVRPWSPPPAQAPVPRGPMTVGVDLYDTHDHSVAQTRALGKSA